MKKTRLLALILAASAAASSTPAANAHTTGAHPSQMSVLCGDANGDGSVTSDDALFTLRTAVDLEKTPDEADLRLLDVDKDDVITSSDAMMILRESTGLGEGLGSFDIVETKELPAPTSAAEGINRFSAQLLRDYCANNNDKDVVVLSPLSVYYALALLENGANGNTQKEIMDVLYRGADEQKLNSELADMMEYYNSGDITQIANAVYVTDRADVVMGEEFGDNIRKYYSSDVFIAPPTPETAGMLNGWISEKTHNMINNVLSPNSLSDATNSVLINALHFKSDWTEPYEDWQVRTDEFTNIDGTKNEVKFLNDWCSVFYEDDNACAFRRSYEGNYSFIGILPNDDVGVDGYISSMNENTIRDLLESSVYGYDVHTAIPKMDLDCDFDLNETIWNMGIHDAFSFDDSDLKRIASTAPDRNIFVNNIRHLTKVVLDEKGTEAAAVTVITNNDVSAVDVEPKPIKYIDLNKQFIFVIYDEQNDIPVFIGAVKTFE